MADSRLMSIPVIIFHRFARRKIANAIPALRSRADTMSVRMISADPTPGTVLVRIGIDVGGMTMRVGAVDDGGTCTHVATTTTPHGAEQPPRPSHHRRARVGSGHRCSGGEPGPETLAWIVQRFVMSTDVDDLVLGGGVSRLGEQGLVATETS